LPQLGEQGQRGRRLAEERLTDANVEARDVLGRSDRHRVAIPRCLCKPREVERTRQNFASVAARAPTHTIENTVHFSAPWRPSNPTSGVRAGDEDVAC
jgi:hypothetical protein